MLTTRQREVAELVARGYSAKRIASALEISVATVQAHIRDAAERLADVPGPPRYRLIVFILSRGPEPPGPGAVT
jgi:DNA-binding NarL/FixJ family response regulator